MSRIQDILAKAERDGTARRTQAGSSGVAAVDGTSALNTAPYPAPAPVGMPLAPAAAPTPVPAPANEPRTAVATLHPALVAAITPHSPVAEQYRAIRTRLTQREEVASIRTVMITSPSGAEGKSVTAANLALTMAQEFHRSVVLVDGDLRNGAVHALFGIQGTPGLAQVLAGEAALEEALVYLPDYRLTILPAGDAPQFPTELLGSTTMRRSMDALRARFDRILLDMPSVMPLADTRTVAPFADGVVMVVRAGVTQRPALDQALASFEEQKVLGLVLNDAQ